MNEPAVKLTIYFSERDRCGDQLLADALFDLYERHRLRTSVLLRGIQGIGPRHQLQSDRLLTLSESLPAISIAVDTRERIEQTLPDVLRITGHGLISLERAQLYAGSDLEHLELWDDSARTVKLTIYGGRSVRSDGLAGYVAAVDRLRAAGVAGASVLLAVDGTLHGERRRSRFFARNAGVPLVLLAVGGGRAISAALPTLRQLISDPVVTVERVRICKSAGTLIAEPDDVPGQDESGLPIWQKLMVHFEEQAKFDGRPLYVELVRRLGEEGAAGATVLRGVRGFYAAKEPFADRLLSLRRNVPLHVVAVDAPAAVKRWWPAVDELTRNAGLVTSELVPALHASRGDDALPPSLAATPTRRQTP